MTFILITGVSVIGCGNKVTKQNVEDTVSQEEQVTKQNVEGNNISQEEQVNKEKASTDSTNEKNVSDDKKIMPAQTKEKAKQKSNIDYSSYSGSWLCKDKNTSIELKVDSEGNVDGGITTVIDTHVPASSITGTIKDGVLVSKISSNDYVPGTLTLSFIDSKTLKCNVKLDPHDTSWNVAEGDMIFVKY